jgi:hypothetical protein
MPSMPSMKNRLSCRDLQEDMEEDDDISPTPPLPVLSSFQIPSTSRFSRKYMIQHSDGS